MRSHEMQAIWSVARTSGVALLLLGTLNATPGRAYPAFGGQRYVSDAAPFCASCHASVDAKDMPELAADAAKRETYVNKHYRALEWGVGAFRFVDEDQRLALLERVKRVDENSSVAIDAPASAKPGEVVEIKVTTTGGIGPQVGIMLVDEPIRYQARPIQGAGWFIVEAPKVVGPGGPQTTWVDRRHNPNAKNLNFVLVYEVEADVDAGSFPVSRVTYRIRTPIEPGVYPVTAAFLYGTADENEMRSGAYKNPPGGITAPSGRVQFSEVVNVRVQ